jgi:hypothetical protein
MAWKKKFFLQEPLEEKFIIHFGKGLRPSSMREGEKVQKRPK